MLAVELGLSGMLFAFCYFFLNVLISFVCIKVLSRHVNNQFLWCITYIKVMLICVMFFSLLFILLSFFSSDYIYHRLFLAALSPSRPSA